MKIPSIIAHMRRQEGGRIEATDNHGVWWQQDFKRGEWRRDNDKWIVDLHKPDEQKART